MGETIPFKAQAPRDPEPTPKTPAQMYGRDVLEHIDEYGENLTQWEIDFVADLVTGLKLGKRHELTAREIRKLEEIHAARCHDTA